MQSRLEDRTTENDLQTQIYAESTRQLKEQITAVRRQIVLTESLFNFSDSEELTDACIYQLKALNAYLDHLLKAVRGKDGQPTSGPVAPVKQEAYITQERIGETMG